MVEVDPTSGKFNLRLPGKLAAMTGRNLARAVEMAFAGFAPAQYRRAVNGTLQSRLDSTMVDQMCRAIENPDDRVLAAALLRRNWISEAQKAESRAEILDLTADLLAIEAPRPLGVQRKTYHLIFFNIFGIRRIDCHDQNCEKYSLEF